MRFIKLSIALLFTVSTFALAEDQSPYSDTDYRKLYEESPTFEYFFKETLLMLQEGRKEVYKNAKNISEVEKRYKKYWENLATECKDGNSKKCLAIHFYMNTSIFKATGISSEVGFECALKGEEYIKQLCLKDKRGDACFVYARGIGEWKDSIQSLTQGEDFRALEELGALLKGEEYKEYTSLANEFYGKGCEYGNEESCISALKYLPSPREKEALIAADRHCIKSNMLFFCKKLGICFSEFGGVQNGIKTCALFGQKYPDHKKAIKYLERAVALGDLSSKAYLAGALLRAGECEKGISILKNLCEVQDDGFACALLAAAYTNDFSCFPADEEKVHYYLRRACNAGFETACEMVEEEYQKNYGGSSN